MRVALRLAIYRRLPRRAIDACVRSAARRVSVRAAGLLATRKAAGARKGWLARRSALPRLRVYACAAHHVMAPSFTCQAKGMRQAETPPVATLSMKVSIRNAGTRKAAVVAEALYRGEQARRCYTNNTQRGTTPPVRLSVIHIPSRRVTVM